MKLDFELYEIEVLTSNERKHRNSKSRWFSVGWTYCRASIVFLISFLAILIVVGIIILLTLNCVEKKWCPVQMYQNSTICKSKACINRALLLKQWMDTSIDPCTDFHQFVCNRKTIQTDDGPKSTQDILKEILTDRKTSSSPGLEKSKEMFTSCLNHCQTKAGDKSILKALMHQMSLEDTTTVSVFSLLGRTVLHESMQGIMPQLKPYVSPYNPNHLFLTITNPVKMQLSHLESTSRFIELLNADMDLSLTEQQIFHFSSKLLDMETFISQSITDNIKCTEIKYETLESLEKKLHNIHWRIVLETYFRNFNYTIDNLLRIGFCNLEYIQKLDSIISQFSVEELKFHIIFRYVFLNREQFSDNYSLLFEKTGEERGLQEYCIASIATGNNPVTRRFTQLYFDTNSKNYVNQIAEYVKKSIIRSIQKSSWIDVQSKSLLITKLNKMKRTIGFSDLILNDTYVENNRWNFAKNIGEYFIHKEIQKENVYLNMFIKNVPNYEYFIAEAMFDHRAFYLTLANWLAYGWVFLVEPYFNEKWPKFINFGITGMILGHEMTHAFNYQKLMNGSSGNNQELFNETFLTTFHDKMTCFAEQYGRFKDPFAKDTLLDGHQTLAENIADHVGVQGMVSAYRIWLADNNLIEEATLPGMSFTSQQSLFISFASKACREMTKIQRSNAQHTYVKYRIIGTLQNSREFADAFNCRPNTPMNPQHKCTLWE